MGECALLGVRGEAGPWPGRGAPNQPCLPSCSRGHLMTLITHSMAVFKAISTNHLWKCSRWGIERRRGGGWGARYFFPCAACLMLSMRDPLPPCSLETFLDHLCSLSRAAQPSVMPPSPARAISLLVLLRLCLGCSCVRPSCAPILELEDAQRICHRKVSGFSEPELDLIW